MHRGLRMPVNNFAAGEAFGGLHEPFKIRKFRSYFKVKSDENPKFLNPINGLLFAGVYFFIL